MPALAIPKNSQAAHSHSRAHSRTTRLGGMRFLHYVVLALGLLGVARAAESTVSTTLSPETGKLVIEARGVPPPAPVFFSAAVEHTVWVRPTELAGEALVSLRLVQGTPEVLTLGLEGDGEVVDVSGNKLRDWAVRTDGDERFLDLRLELPVATGAELLFTVRTKQRVSGAASKYPVLLVTPGDAVGFAAKITLVPEGGVEVRTTVAEALEPGGKPLEFFNAVEAGRLEIALVPRGASAAEAELVNAQLAGRLEAAGKSVEFRLKGSLRVRKAGARLRLLSGGAAPADVVAGPGWHVELVPHEGAFAYDLVAEREGTVPIELGLIAAVNEAGEWRGLEFAMPAGAVVPVQLDGLGDGVSFKRDAAVVPAAAGQGWRGFLPADGRVALAWKRGEAAAEGALAFASEEHAEVRIGAGLLRQRVQVGFGVLQGKLERVRLRLTGEGEILGVEGAQVLSWSVEAGRVLDVRLSRPIEAQGSLTIHSQAQLGAWPARVEPLRVTPEGGVRHSGYLRVANSGAVRIEVAETSGLMQLAPEQWPGAALEAGPRQVLVYRFPSATYAYRLLAAQIQPEVAVSAVSTYEVAETSRAIVTSLELDIREAPLREWSLRIPEGYAVVALSGAEVADHALESEAVDGYRTLRVLFRGPVDGRRLLHLRLESNQSAAAGEWALMPLQFPGAKSVRGHIGAVAVAGYRLVPARTERLVEVPLNLFPRPTQGLQQAWRLREPEWTAAVQIEALGQSVQADVFHLYTLKEGMVTSSVLLNYFVVGAPASEWRIEIPTTAGNIDVVGQNVRRDWRREGNQLVVTLHQPVLGAATLLVTFEEPMSARGGAVQPGAVRPLGVQAERGYVQVVSPLQVKHAVRKAEGGLLKLEPTELPAEYRAFSSAPSLATYQYTGRPFALELEVEWYAAGETVEQVVDFAKMATQVSRDGQVVTEALFFVKTRGSGAFRVVLSPGAKLWEARVDNELVNARADGAQTLIPLPARANPNEPALVALRLGQAAAENGTRLALAAPRAVAATTAISEWTLRADAGRLLLPQGGNAEPTQRVLTETGFEWILKRNLRGTLWVAGLGLVGLLLLRLPRSWATVTGLLACALTAVALLIMAGDALVMRQANLREFTLATTVVPASEAVTVTVANLPEWRALLVGWGVAALVASTALVVAQRWLRARWTAPVAVVLATVGVLAQHGGALWFYAGLMAALVLLVMLPVASAWWRARSGLADPRSASSATTAATIAVAGLLALCGTSSLEAAQPKAKTAAPIAAAATKPAAAEKALETLVQRWTIHAGRLAAEVEATGRGVTGDSFLLLRHPAVLTDVTGEGVRVSKVARDGQMLYYLVLERDGAATARVRFELTVGERAQAVTLPTGPAVVQRMTVELDQGGWEFASPYAVQVTPTAGLAENRSGATLVLRPEKPGAAYAIQLLPRRRDLSAEATQFFVEAAQVYQPGPGGVNGLARFTVQPVQGRVGALEIDVPSGLTVAEVGGGPVGAWRFDPATSRLRVEIVPAQAQTFRLDVRTQRGAGELPFALTAEPLRVRGAAGEAGLLALAFGGDAQPEAVKTTDLSPVNTQDFDATLIGRGRNGQPSATLQNAWRYGATGGRAELKVAAVAPEVRVATKQVLTLDDDRLVLGVELRATIARVGIFKLGLVLPEGIEVEALSGGALNQWTEAEDNGQRVVTLHLHGRTLGEQVFNLSLTGAAPRPQEGWTVPRLVVRDAARQTGELLLVPGKGIRLRAGERENVTQLDPRAAGGTQPGTLGFRLLETGWSLKVGVEALDPWVTVQALHEVTLREGQTLARLGLRYRVDNAALKTMRLRLPGLSADSARTVRATGTAVSDIVPVPEAGADVWEVRFQRSVAGETDVQLEYQGSAARPDGGETIATPEFIGARQTTLFVAVRGGGRLELTANDLPRGWTRVDWAAVPAALQQRGERGMPALCFRVAEPERPLAVTVRRHEVAEALKLRATQADLLTLFAPTGASLTAVELKIDVMEKGALRVRLPVGARLFNTFVNGQSVTVVRDGETWLFHVAPGTPGQRGAAVRLVYSAQAGSKGDVGLVGPSLSVPLENVTWRVVLPPGYALDDYRGALRLREERSEGAFDIADYRLLVKSRQSAEVKQAEALMKQANTWLARGEQDKASEALNRASNTFSTDLAFNEDARVQLRNLKEQQAILGLNTRRQRLYLSNGAELNTRNAQLEEAANLNPFLQGKVNFDPRQVDQLLMGNTSDENTALKGIAAKIVDQQLGAEPAPSAIDVTLPERGRVVTFTRTLQVDGGAPLELALGVVRDSGSRWPLVAGLVIAIAAIAVLAAQVRREFA